MSDIAPISRPHATAYTQSTAAAHRQANGSPRPSRGDDTVEISTTAQFLGKLRDLPDVRQDLVDRIKAQIADGTYETPDKLAAAADALAYDLEG